MVARPFFRFEAFRLPEFKNDKGQRKQNVFGLKMRLPSAITLEDSGVLHKLAGYALTRARAKTIELASFKTVLIEPKTVKENLKLDVNTSIGKYHLVYAQPMNSTRAAEVAQQAHSYLGRQLEWLALLDRYAKKGW